MTDELDTLRPEVRESLERLSDSISDAAYVAPENENGDRTALQAIRAELLRLAAIEADALIALDCEHDWQVEHECAEKAEAELAALKARIAEAPVAYLTSKTGVGPCNVASMAHGVVFDSSSYGKSVRVVLDE